MSGVRVTATVMVMVVVALLPPARPHPTHAHTTPAPSEVRLKEGGVSEGEGGQGWSLLDTLQRLDQLLRRHNDYNDIMLESGEEEDQLSRLLYKLQAGKRLREDFYDPYQPQVPYHGQQPPAQYLVNTVQQHRLPPTTHSEPGNTALTRIKRKAKKSKEKRGHHHHHHRSREHHGPGGRSREKHRPKGRRREKPGPGGKRCGPNSRERGRHGPRSRERGRHGPRHRPSSRGKHGPHSREKHHHRSRERCPDDETTITTATTPTTTPTTPFTLPLSRGTTPIIILPPSGDGDASVSREIVTFDPDAETLIPFL